MLREAPPSPAPPARRALAARLFDALLIALIVTGLAYRFTHVNWSQGANLHPDEYGLTSTLTQLRLPDSAADYFNTRLSPISPYIKYDAAGQKVSDGPDNRMRWGQWPIILLRAAAELSGNTGYDELRLMGRTLSGAADALTLLVIFFIGARLYGRRVGLLAAALNALAVLPIQQSHFMTADNFAALFTALALYAAVRIAQLPPAWRAAPDRPYQVERRALPWYLAFGVFFGMAVASRINLLPLGGLVGVAAFISLADLPLRHRGDLGRIAAAAAALLALAVLAAALTFRLTQPMTFRALSGDTTLFTLQPNPDWLESMQVAQMESNGIGGGPPGEQWTARPAILFPLINMLVWGLGLPLGLAAWGGWLAALWQWLRRGQGWRVHLIPLVWVGGYFFFMGTRWVKSVRYFLPVYPFLCLLAAWGLLALWRRSAGGAARRRLLPAALLALVLAGTLAWATAFTSAVYWSDHTRLQATRWIYHNIPAPVTLRLQKDSGETFTLPLGAPDGQRLGSQTLVLSLTAPQDAHLLAIELAHASAGGVGGQVLAVLAAEPEGRTVLDQAILNLPPGAGGAAQAAFQQASLAGGATYFLRLSTPPAAPPVTLRRTVLANESWDEGLPVPFLGYDPFGQFYRGLTMQVRWMDDENKRAMFLETLDAADYLIIPSQRALWAACRLPRMYPMTMAYYRALFDGQLGFTQVAQFSAPLRLGPLYVSDLAGSAAWGAPPDLPLFNHNPLAAEEAFSVYDHPPVWIFRKQPNFSLEQAAAVLNAVDLGQAVVQSPRSATGAPCP